MTLVEALAHIQSVEKCHSVAAQVHLKREIGDGVIPVKWADSKGPKDKPNVSKLQRSQLVLSGHGLASGGLSLRPLLVLRSAVHTTWSGTTSEGATPPRENSSARRNSAQRKEEEKYEQWMSLVEAIEHIRISQDCNSVEALRQLKREIRDGMVRAQWEDSKGPKDRPDPEYLQASHLLLIASGFAPDSVQEIYRPLVVKRSAVKVLWPLSDYRREESHRTASKPAGEQRQDKQATPTERIREAAREVYREAMKAGKKPPNKTEAEPLVRVISGATRPRIRPILMEDEFDRQRWKRGHHRKP
jgi:hypothetical protein